MESKLKKILVMFTSFCLVIAVLGLFGCENDQNTEVICKNNPELCEDLHKDSWCRFEKADLIRHRYALKETEQHTGKQLYQQLIFLEKYSKCIELAAGVQHLINTDRTVDRKRAFAVSTQNLEQLQEYTKDSKEVFLAFYRWVRFNDPAAFSLVDSAFKQGQVNDVIILEQLAVHYLKINADISKAIYAQLFGHILTDTPVEDSSEEDAESYMDISREFNTDWLLGLANVYQQQQQFAQVYLLTKINLSLTEQTASDVQLLALINNDKKLAIKLNKQAKETASALANGHISKNQLAALFD
jgi:hypothetical protein